MKIKQNELIQISRNDIYSNYCKYIEPIINYMYDNFGMIKGADDINSFIDNTDINGYGFVNYNGNLYITELADDEDQLNDYDYFTDSGDKYILIPIE